MKKLNGLAKWIMVALAVGTIFYNTLVTHIVLKNDVKHLKADVDRVIMWIFDKAKK